MPFDRQAAKQAGYSDQEIDAYLNQQAPRPQVSNQSQMPQGGLLERYAEPAMTMASGLLAEPVAGLAGLATLPFGGTDQATQNIEATREALTYQPRTQAGQQGMQAVGQFMAPVTSRFQRAGEVGGQAGYELAGPIGGAIGETLPTAVSMMLGAGGRPVKPPKVSSSAAKKLLREATPDVQQLKTTARGIYDELDNTGVTINPGRIDRLGNSLRTVAVKEGFHPKIHPKVGVALDEFEKALGTPQTLTEIDTLRKITRAAARSSEPDEARLGSMLVEKVDDFLDDLKPSDLGMGKDKAIGIGEKYKDARQLWHRAKKSELLDDAFEKAKNQASGFENGIRTQFRSLLNNKKKMRGFTPEEKAAMQYVVRGGTAENIAKKIGRLGFGEGQATSMLMGSLGIAGGAAVGGTPGAVAVPLIGQVSRNLAQKLTRNNAELSNLIVKAGPNGRQVINAYMRKVPAKERNIAELTELLMRPEVSLQNLKKAIPESGQQRKLIADAVFFADFMRTQQEQEQQ